MVETQAPNAKTPPSPGKLATWSPKRDVSTPKRDTPKKFAESPFSPVSPFVSDLSSSKPVKVITDPKTGAPVILSMKKKKTKEPAKVGPITTTTFDPERKAWVRKTVQRPQPHDNDDVRAATSPKKRVVSDSHWRKDRSASKPVTPKQEVKPKKLAPQKSMPDMRAKQKPSPGTGVWAVRKPLHDRPKWTTLDPSKDSPFTSYPAKTSRTPTTHARQARRASDESFIPDHAVRAPTLPPATSNQRRTSRQRSRVTPPPSIMGADEALSLASPDPDDSISRVNAPRSAPRRLSQALKEASKPEADPRKPSGGVPLFSRANIFSKVQTPPKPAGGRIESWLGHTSDPFWEETSSVADETTKSLKSPVPEPLNLKKRTTSRSETDRKPLGSSGQNRHFSFEEGDESVLSVSTKRSPRDKENETARRRSSRGKSKREDENEQRLAGVGLGINVPRAFPTTGKALSTIASEVTCETREPAARKKAQNVPAASSYASSVISQSTIRGESDGLKRRLTKHDDLISVLSAPNDTPSLVSARSFRSKRPQSSTSIEEVMKELVADESKYQAQLQTLVDGVVPVLLSSVLARPAKAPNGTTDATRAVVDMGVALERLKTQHRRIVKSDPVAFLEWAQNVARIYEDYVKVWRMGFDDSKLYLPKSDGTQNGAKLSRNAAGALVDSKGEKVDVEFLLKRPLVRVKSLTKTIKV